jgi:hypothetical protein
MFWSAGWSFAWRFEGWIGLLSCVKGLMMVQGLGFNGAEDER